MLRFVALFALVAVALAEPEADPQVFTYNHVAGVPVVHPVVGAYATHVVKPVVGATHVVKPVVPVVKYHVPVVKAAVPVVKYVDPHHTEGMTEGGVPEKTDSVKIAEKQHEIAQIMEKSKHKFVVPYAHTYAGYPFVHPYVASHVASHVVAKREADSDADPYLLYSTHHAGVAHTGVYPYSSVYPYTYGYPYTTAVSGYTYPVVHPSVMKHPVVHHSVMKREADSESQFYYSHYNTPYAYNYGYGYPYTYNNVYNTYGVYGR